MNDAQRPFYRLAVEEAEAAYNIRSNHPVFLYFMQDADAELQAYADDGRQMFVTSTLIALAVQAGLVCVAFFIRSKLA